MERPKKRGARRSFLRDHALGHKQDGKQREKRRPAKERSEKMARPLKHQVLPKWRLQAG